VSNQKLAAVPAAHRCPSCNQPQTKITRVLGVDDGPPSRGHHGENHTRRPERTEALKGQGPKTRAANRERVKGSRLYNPP